MAVIGIVTNDGILKCRQAQNDEGFKIFPEGFGISRTRGPLDPTRIGPNAGLWYSAPISTRVVVSDNTVKYICTIPAGALPPGQTDFVREIYLYGKDSLGDDFLFALGQTTSDIIYEPNSSTTVELEVSLTNADLSSMLVFYHTQATELSEHNTDPNAHSEIITSMNRAGLFLRSGGAPFTYAGQNFDEKAEFEGVRASGTLGAVTFRAVYTGPLGNGIALEFDGALTADQVVLAWNNANPNNPASHNGTGLEVFSAQTLTLSGGSLAVGAFNLVYRAADGYYKRGLADGTIKQRVVGVADTANRIVRAGGFLTYASGYPVGTELYLSPTSPGAFTDIPSEVKVAVVVSSNMILLSSFGGGGTAIGQDFDAIVTDTPGFKKFPTTQEAIDATGDNARILIDKFEGVAYQLNPHGRSLTFVCNGPDTGWYKFPGQIEKIKIAFGQVPTSGTWRIEWNSQVSNDMAFNAPAATVESEFNAFTGHTGVTVTGDYSTGFTITFSDVNIYPLPTFIGLGQNEIQRINFSETPDDGTLRLRFGSETTINIPWNSTPLQIEAYIEALLGINDVSVTGSFALKYLQIEYVNADGRKPWTQVIIDNTSLTKTTVPVVVTPSTLQEGQYPANNLFYFISPVGIEATLLQGGLPLGPDTLMVVAGDNTRFLGQGLIKDFQTGVDLNGKVNCEVAMRFQDVIIPVAPGGSSPVRDYHTHQSFGIQAQRVLTVGDTYGYPGDYNDLWSALSAANTGDKILVLRDQYTSVARTLDKDVEIEFAHGSRLLVTAPVVGTALTFDGPMRTRNWHVVFNVSGTYDQAILLSGARGHHHNFTLECSGNSTVVTEAFVLGATAEAIYLDGLIYIGTSTVSQVLNNLSGLLSHNVLVRDRDNGITHDLYNRRPPKQEVPTGTVDGVNPFFVLSEVPASPDSVLVMVDGIPRLKTTHWTIAGDTIQFLPGFIPQVGQDVYAYYLPTGLLATPPTAKAGAIETQADGSPVVATTMRLNFGPDFRVFQDPGDVQKADVSVKPGVGYRTEVHTITAGDLGVKSFDLSHDISSLTNLICFKIGDTLRLVGEDFLVTGTRTIGWDGLGLDGSLSIGDRLFFSYFEF